MANTRELRRRIKSVKNTSQITKAMEMVAATKMRRAQNQALAGRPYSENLNFSLSQLSTKISPDEAHPLLKENGSSVIGVILLTTDKALCGALNTNVLRALSSLLSSLSSRGARNEGSRDLVFFTIGKKGRSFIARTGKNLEADFDNLDVITFDQARHIGKLAKDLFLSKRVGEVYLVYPHFVSTLRQEPKIVKLLPIRESDLAIREIDQTVSGEFLFEPNSDDLLDFILNHVIETKIYQALLETKASEHSARMIAMQNATNNAKDLVEDLQLTYNQTRQQAITTELLEITTAQAAME